MSCAYFASRCGEDTDWGKVFDFLERAESFAKRKHLGLGNYESGILGMLVEQSYDYALEQGMASY
jgi:hypothetical protein